MAQNLVQTDLDAAQTVKRAFVDADDAHRINIVTVDPLAVFPTTQAALNVLGSFNIDFSSISHTTPFVITAGLASIAKQILVADTTGQTDKILFGTTTLYTNPGCERAYPVAIPASTSISIQSAESSDPVAGNYIITILG